MVKVVGVVPTRGSKCSELERRRLTSLKALRTRVVCPFLRHRRNQIVRNLRWHLWGLYIGW